jgi:hypothetical protein
MWKRTVLMAGLLASLGLPALAGQRSSAHDFLPGKLAVPQFNLTLDGKLVYHDGWGPQIPEWDPWIGPALETGGSWLGLDFGKNRELLQQAAKLYGKKVRVTGRLEKRTLPGLIPHQINVLVVTVLRPIEAGQQTIQVEVKGKLTRRIERIPDPDPRWGPCSWIVRQVWQITANGTAYQLDFAGDPSLLSTAGKLEGRTVILTGTRQGNIIQVRSLKADVGGILKKTVYVEMKGRFLLRADHADILLPDSRLVVSGHTYVVNLGNDRNLWNRAVALDGHTAIVTGTLNGDTITATSIKADNDFIKKAVTVEIKGRLYWNHFPGRCMVPEFALATGKEHFALHIANDDVRQLARKLSGQDVIVTGTLTGNQFDGKRISVTSLNADDSTYVKVTVSVTLQGKLHYVLTDACTGRVLSTSDDRPKAFYECTRLWYGVTINGRLYLLDPDGNKAFRGQAE